MEDLIIIGYGVTGFAALIKANELGVKPVIIGHGPMVGLTLIETRNKGIDVDYRVVKATNVAKAHILGDTRGSS
jgi:heterodisulfide reductase subunit A-like polyferredoxin